MILEPIHKRDEVFRISVREDRVVVATRNPRVARTLERVYKARPWGMRAGKPDRMSWSWELAHTPWTSLERLATYAHLESAHDRAVEDAKANAITLEELL